jgi:hypothetical protein
MSQCEVRLGEGTGSSKDSCFVGSVGNVSLVQGLKLLG